MKNSVEQLNECYRKGECQKHPEASESASTLGSDADILQRKTEIAMKKAVELGMMPKFATECDYLRNWSDMKEVVRAILSSE